MDFLALAQQCAPFVSPTTMLAIAKTENRSFAPFAIGVNGGAALVRQPASFGEAVVTAKWLIANGYSIDLGLMQINSVNLNKLGMTVEDAFTPCKNVHGGGTILAGNYKDASRKIAGEQAALHAAISAYNTGNYQSGFSNGYVQRVLNNAGGTTLAGSAQVIPLSVASNSRTKARQSYKPKGAVWSPSLASSKDDSWNVNQANNTSEMVN